MNKCFFGDCRDSLRHMAEEGITVNAVITSPPYWGLRQYGGPSVVFGGDPVCVHEWNAAARVIKGSGKRGASSQFSNRAVSAAQDQIMQFDAGQTCQTCQTCGAWYGQLGLEAIHDCLAWARGEQPCGTCYVCHLREIFALVRDVLRDDGTLWLNLGDCYATSGGPKSNLGASSLKGSPVRSRDAFKGALSAVDKSRAPGLKRKDLVGIPWRVALALQADGWYLRNDNIWWKLNGMPSSSTDRTTMAHEYFFMLAKSEEYYFDHEAIKEPIAESSKLRIAQATFDQQTGGPKDYGKTGTNQNMSQRRALENFKESSDGMRHKRSVWPVATQRYDGAHCATFPPSLITPCILAGAPGGGTVLDIFFGTGTVGMEAQRLGRNWYGCELDESCRAQQEERLSGSIGMAV